MLNKGIGSLLVLLTIAVLPGCRTDDDGMQPGPVDKEYTFSFNEDLEGWEAGFADYPVGEEGFYELSHEHAALPSGVNVPGKALKISGNNHSDDLFMFAKKQLDGLEPSTRYRLTFTIELASQYPESSVGVGGSPGSSVYLKAGAAAREPQPIDQDGQYRMNIDKGNQATGGEDMMVLGTIGIPGEQFTYTLITRHNQGQPFQATTDNAGRLWVVVGTDSGFEANTTLYYNQIKVHLQKLSATN